MVIKSLVGLLDQLAVEPLFSGARFVATDQKYGLPMRVEGKSYTSYTIRGLEPQFFHVRVMRAVEGIDPGAT